MILDRMLNHRLLYRAGLFSAAILLAGCVQSVNWVHQSIPQERWTTDLGSCRAKANRMVNDELRDQGSFSSAHDLSIDQRIATFEAKRRVKLLTERCMRDRGYRKASPKGSKEA